MGFTARENQDGAKSKDKQGFPKVPADQKFADDLGYVTKAPKPAKKKVMPVNSSAHKLYAELVSQGKSQKDAAKIAQAKTGLSLVTGRPPKTKGYGASYKGQYK